MRRLASISIACVLLISLSSQRVATRAQTPTVAASGSQGYAFTSGAGILFFYVRPDRTADFEAVAARIGEVLETIQEPSRKAQAAGWRMFKSIEVTREAAIYLFFIDPAVSGADYDPVKLLGEALPTEAQALYERLKNSIIRVERMGLAKIR